VGIPEPVTVKDVERVLVTVTDIVSERVPEGDLVIVTDLV